MKKPSLLSIVIPIILLIFGGIIFYLVTTQSQDVRSRAATDKVNLSLSATPSQVAINGTVTINVLINTTTTYKVSAVELAMTYDSAVFDPVSIAAGTFLPTVLTPGVIQSGTATITLGSGTTPKPGSGTLATVKLKRKIATSGIVKVDAANTKVAGLNASGVAVTTNILGTAGTVTITAPGNTPIPTAKTSITPTLTQKITPSTTAKISPTKVPSSTPVPTLPSNATPSPITQSSPTPEDDMESPTPTIHSGFGGLFPPELVDAEKVLPTPLSQSPEDNQLIDDAIIDSEMQDTLTTDETDITPVSESTEPFDLSPAPKKQSPFLILFGVAGLIAIGGAIVFILQKKGIIHLPFMKKHEEPTAPPQMPTDQTQSTPPPVTDQPQPPITNI